MEQINSSASTSAAATGGQPTEQKMQLTQQ
jgi:hypothetical protein